jgi:very-short-patch-repair endonuclease
VSAARLYQLAGLPKWTPAERSHLLLPAGRTYEARAGIRLQSGLHPGEVTRRAGFPLTTLDATVASIPALLSLDDLICLLDSALAAGWLPVPSSQKGQRKLRKALALADKRAESTFETLLRLLLVRAGVPPETLQFQVLSEGGRKIARLDLAWPSLKLAVEADGREHHDAPKALYRDRARANALELEGWTILRFTWSDLVSRPEWIVAQISLARNRLFAAKTAA